MYFSSRAGWSGLGGFGKFYGVHRKVKKMFLERLPEIEYVDKNGKEKKKIRTKVPPLNSVT